MSKILRKTLFTISLILVFSFAFVMSAEAKEVKCTYGGYTVTSTNGTIKVTLATNPSNFYKIQYDAIRASDLQKSDGSPNCPSKIYVKTSIDGSGRSGNLYFSFLSSTYEGATTTPFMNGTVDGVDITNTDGSGNNNDDDDDNNNGGGGGVKVNPSEPIDCDDFEYTEAGKTYNLIQEIFDIMMIAGPILLVIFGIIDFSKASLASDEQALKKAQQSFIKRAIAAVLLFLIPFIINIILGIAFDAGVFGDLTTRPDTCVTAD